MQKNNSACLEIKRKLWKHGFLFAFFLIALSFFATAFWKKQKVFRQEKLPDHREITAYLEHGDIILRSGVGFWSELFREANNRDKRFSHVGIVKKNTNRDFLVLHAEADDYSGKGFVRLDRLEDFITASDAIGVSRLKNSDREKFFRSAEQYTGRPFDWKFNKDDDSAIYCTELIDLALKSSGIAPGLKDSGGLLLPESCLDPEYFQEIQLHYH